MSFDFAAEFTKPGAVLIAMYDWDSIESTEINFKRGDKLILVECVAGWYMVRDKNGREGLAPSNMVELQLTPEEQRRMDQLMKEKANDECAILRNERESEQVRLDAADELRHLTYLKPEMTDYIYALKAMPSLLQLYRNGTDHDTWYRSGLLLGRITYHSKAALRDMAAEPWLMPLVARRLADPATSADANCAAINILRSYSNESAYLKEIVDQPGLLRTMRRFLRIGPGMRNEAPSETVKMLRDICFVDELRPKVIEAGVQDTLQELLKTGQVDQEFVTYAKSTLLMLGKLNRSNTIKKQGDKKEGGGGYLMMSYNWGHQHIILRLKKRLEELGYTVWMDTDEMKGDIVEKMAAAVENAQVVAMGYSTAYSKSDNCRLEGAYAHQLQKKTIPLMMEPNAMKLGGWLGIILGNKKWFNMWDEAQFETTVQEIVKELGSSCKGEITEVANSAEKKSKLALLEERVVSLEKSLQHVLQRFEESEKSLQNALQRIEEFEMSSSPGKKKSGLFGRKG